SSTGMGPIPVSSWVGAGQPISCTLPFHTGVRGSGDLPASKSANLMLDDPQFNTSISSPREARGPWDEADFSKSVMAAPLREVGGPLHWLSTDATASQQPIDGQQRKQADACPLPPAGVRLDVMAHCLAVALLQPVQLAVVIQANLVCVGRN